MESTTTSICDAEIPLQLRKLDVFAVSYSKSLESLIATAQQTAQFQGKLEDVKGELRQAEDDLVKAIAVKTRKEAKRMALMEAIAYAKRRVEELETCVEQQRAKKQEFNAFLSQQSLALAAFEGNLSESTELNDETQEAISWYNTVLGFHVKGGQGVKFTFKNINLNNPNEEYSFTIRHENNTYTLLSCEPSLKDTKELIHELNKMNGLFKFVRVVRKKFQEAVVKGSIVPTTIEREESTCISSSAPVLSMSSIRSDSTIKENEHQVEPTEDNTHREKQRIQRRIKSTVLSPGSAASVRQSPRLKALMK